MHDRDSRSLVSGEQRQVWKISLSHRTVTHSVKLTDKDIASKLNNNAEFFKLYSLALDESNAIKDTAQLLMFIWRIKDSFEITGEFLAMERKNMGRGGQISMLATQKETIRKMRTSLDSLHGEFCCLFSVTWWPVPIHRTLKQHHKKCNGIWSISSLTPS